MARFTDGRRTFELGRPVRNVFSGKAQIMWTRLSRDRDAVVLRPRELVDGFLRCHVDDVHPRSEFARQPDHQTDRFDLGFRWTRGEIRRIVRTWGQTHGSAPTRRTHGSVP